MEKEMINREGTINGIEWLEEDANQEIMSKIVEKNKAYESQVTKLATDNANQKFEQEKTKCIFLAELYGTIERAYHYDNIPWFGKKVCYQAEGLVQLCRELKWVDREWSDTLMNHLHRLITNYNKIEEKSDLV